MAQAVRGKALVAKLRAQAGVRDPEALAAYLGRFKKARKAGKSVAAAVSAAKGGDSGQSSGQSKEKPQSDSDYQRKKLSRTKPPSEAMMRANRMEQAKRGGWSKERLEATLKRDFADLKKLQAAYKRRRTIAAKRNA